MPERHDEGRRLGLTPQEVEARRAEFDRRNRLARRFEALNPGRRSTLGGARKHAEWVWVYCERIGCRHSAAVPLAPLIIRWGPDAPWDYLRRFFRCTRCGFKKTTTRLPSWGGAHIGFSPVCELSRWTGREVWPCEISHELDDRVYGAKFDEYFHPVLGYIRFEDMCNLYSQTRSRDEIRGLFRVSDNRAYGFEPMPAIFPRWVAPVVRLATDGERELVPMTWGFPLIQKGLAPKPVTNIRDDGVLTSPFWRPSFEARRCLVPASSYCEPDSNKPAGWHWFALKGDHKRPLFAFPGLWKRYKGPLRKGSEPVEIDVYAFMTTKPNALTATIMHDRMPVLLSEEADFETWLTGSPEAAFGLIRTYDAERMRIVQSGAEKQDLLGAAEVSVKS